MILAHGSGIDDVAFVVLPLLVFIALRWLKRRQSQEEERDAPAGTRNDATST